jgi:hypothetical protein
MITLGQQFDVDINSELCAVCNKQAGWHMLACGRHCEQPDGHKNHPSWCDEHVPRNCEHCNTHFDDETEEFKIAPRNQWWPCVEIIDLRAEVTLLYETAETESSK